MAGLLWGARNGVQFALTFVALKALPVLILGGFTSVPGAIVGGLIIGASERLAEYRPLVVMTSGLVLCAVLFAGAARRLFGEKSYAGFKQSCSEQAQSYSALPDKNGWGGA